MKRSLLLVVVLAVLAGFQRVSGQEATPNPVPPLLEAEMLSLEATTVTLRGLETLSSIGHEFPTREATIEYLRESFNTTLPEDQAARYTQFYAAFDLLPADTDLRDVYLRLLGSQVAGYYDTDTKTMNVLPLTADSVGGDLSLLESVTYVHEYTHALQDQHFGLDSLIDAVNAANAPDQSLAVTSLIEGDATTVMNLYTQQVAQENPLAAFQLLAEGFQSGGMVLPEGIPPILTTELLYPYEGGMSFITVLYREGGWERVNAAYDNPPQTMEQIMHPEKYLAGELSTTVLLADPEPVLGEGWTRIWDTTLGEFYLYQYLRTQLPNDQVATAAAGWGGDHFYIYTNADTNQSAWVLRLAWDTFADSVEFQNAYEAFANARFGSTATNGCWTNDQEAICVNLRAGTAAQDVLIAYAPTVRLANGLLAVQW